MPPHPPRPARLLAALVVMALPLVGPSAALAHSAPTTMWLASTAASGGALALLFDFSTVARVSYSATVGDVEAYSGGLPGFEGFAADDPTAGAWQLAAGTTVTLTVTGLQPGHTAVKVGAVVLDAVGESATLGVTPLAHVHPEWQMFVHDGELAEGSVSFRLSASGPTAYAESPVYTVNLASGPVPPFAFDVAAYDSAAVACQSAIAKAGGKIVAKTMTTLQKCLVAVTALQAKMALLTPPADLESTRAAAQATCTGAGGASAETTPLGRIEALENAATAAIASRCGGFLDDRAIADHVATVSCRAQSALAAMFPSARPTLALFDTLPSQGGDPMSRHLPCLTATIGH